MNPIPPRFLIKSVEKYAEHYHQAYTDEIRKVIEDRLKEKYNNK